jgi:hypothetical protein
MVSGYRLNYNPSEVTLVYTDKSGTEHRQSVADLVEVGTLIDPEDGEDMEVSFVQVVTS